MILNIDEKFSFFLSANLLPMVATVLDFQNSFQSHLYSLLLLHLLFLLCPINLKNDSHASHFCLCFLYGHFNHQVPMMKT